MSDRPHKQTNIGDGVYVSSDGSQIWLRTERESGWHEIALEPETYAAALTEYVARLRAKWNNEDVHPEP